MNAPRYYMENPLKPTKNSRSIFGIGAAVMAVSLAVLLSSIALIGCQGPEPSTCTVAKVTGGNQLTCPDGTSAFIPDGKDGQGISVVVATPEQCPTGGIFVTSGQLSFPVCNGDRGPIGPGGPIGPTGPPGPPGQPGTPVVVSVEPPGANCPDGGVKLTVGTSVEYVCNGSTPVLPPPPPPPPPLGVACPVNLGTAGDFGILSKSGISTVPASAITGDIGVSPIAATSITGFSLIIDSSNTFSTSTQVVGKVYAADYGVPTPSKMTTAVGDMETAFTAAAACAPDVTELGAGNISGMTLPAGVYKWSTGVLVASDIILAGSATDVWVFQIAGNLTVNNGVRIKLSGGALPKNIFWQVSGAVGIGTVAHTEGILLSQTAITMQTGASANGRLLAQSAVTLDKSTVTQP
jgi:hypothetical protein